MSISETESGAGALFSGNEESKLKLSLETRRLGDVIVVHCEGRIVFRDEAMALSRVAVEALRAAQEVVLDLEGVERIDSAGLGELVFVYVSAEGFGNTVKLAGPNPRVRALLDLTNLSSVFQIYPSLAEALAPGEAMDCRA
jgi:anti-sigma B factor antagonist